MPPNRYTFPFPNRFDRPAPASSPAFRPLNLPIPGVITGTAVTVTPSHAQQNAIAAAISAGLTPQTAHALVQQISDGQADYLTRFIKLAGSTAPPNTYPLSPGAFYPTPSGQDVYAGLTLVKQQKGPLDTSWAIRQNFGTQKMAIFNAFLDRAWITNPLGHWPPTPQDEFNAAVFTNAHF